MTFISLCTALYDYHPQSEGELAIQEGELVYIVEKSTVDDWWKAKKRAVGDDEEEPLGLIPNNYVQEVSYLFIRGPQERQQDWELSTAGLYKCPVYRYLSALQVRGP